MKTSQGQKKTGLTEVKTSQDEMKTGLSIEIKSFQDELTQDMKEGQDKLTQNEKSVHAEM